MPILSQIFKSSVNFYVLFLSETLVIDKRLTSVLCFSGFKGPQQRLTVTGRSSGFTLYIKLGCVFFGNSLASSNDLFHLLVDLKLFYTYFQFTEVPMQITLSLIACCWLWMLYKNLIDEHHLFLCGTLLPSIGCQKLLSKNVIISPICF